jgi:hypothetical protein
MSLINVGQRPTANAAQLRGRSWDWLGTFWAHSVSTEADCGESQWMSSRSSERVRLCHQHPETGSIAGSSTEKMCRNGAVFSSPQESDCGSTLSAATGWVMPTRLGREPQEDEKGPVQLNDVSI